MVAVSVRPHLSRNYAGPRKREPHGRCSKQRAGSSAHINVPNQPLVAWGDSATGKAVDRERGIPGSKPARGTDLSVSARKNEPH